MWFVNGRRRRGRSTCTLRVVRANLYGSTSYGAISYHNKWFHPGWCHPIRPRTTQGWSIVSYKSEEPRRRTCTTSTPMYYISFRVTANCYHVSNISHQVWWKTRSVNVEALLLLPRYKLIVVPTLFTTFTCKSYHCLRNLTHLYYTTKWISNGSKNSK